MLKIKLTKDGSVLLREMVRTFTQLRHRANNHSKYKILRLYETLLLYPEL
jgi:hypothetical protein